MVGEEFQVFPRREGKEVVRGNEGVAPSPSCSRCHFDYLLSRLAEALIKSRINPRIALPGWKSPPCCPCSPSGALPRVFQQPFPKKFPFSEFVPKVYSQIKEFIYACLKFSEDLHLRWETERAQPSSNMDPHPLDGACPGWKWLWSSGILAGKIPAWLGMGGPLGIISKPVRI